jgi:hypothetical protein
MTTIAISALPIAASAATTDVLPIVQGGTTKQLTNALLFTSPTLTTPILGAATGTSVTLSGLNATNAAAPTIASATTIAPTKQITFISGTTAVVTITAPAPISAGGGTITLIPTGVFTWTAAGNIALAGTAVVSRALTMTYDVTTNKWYPSYV